MGKPKDLLSVGCLTSQQHASVSQGRICLDNFMSCPTEVEAADQTFYLYLTQSQYTDTWPTSPSTDPMVPGAWQGSHWSASFEVWTQKNPVASRIWTPEWGWNSSLVVFGLAVHSVAGSILLWGNFPVEGILPLELKWVQTPFPKKLFWMRV